PLYECGFKRIGCIGCPMAGTEMRKFEFERYPTYKKAYIHAFDRMLESRRERGMPIYDEKQTGTDLFEWWLNG
ncbi:MAG: phosphoadenosine phosphosulfate reductase, partial [Oscillospiraceae bacterium]|nr:phosphoadenosine phosphosulfate reductase [Oscillospiraceae bacterium]